MESEDLEQALCRGMNQDIFYEPRFENQAVAICQNCPIRNACLTEALNDHQVWGVWGGLTYSQRKLIKVRSRAVE